MHRKFFYIMGVIILLRSLSIANAQDVKTKIDPETDILTMINILTPVDGDQEALITQLELALQKTMIHEPGFISGNVHRSLDSKHVVNYAQWQDKASLEAFIVKLQAGDAPEMAKVFTMATPDFHPYTIVSSHQRLN
ncbi:antibiotic biosynthesis monooxygenase [Kiloniella sp. EL199]|uniref:antibiotic biosynthesis monooxygenase family protein n=1 Tax=Kiloniella sp. EL199 TaxID=2107581 RepID=UPI001C1F7B87|nr:antibiotic biosynthesis monooxygenase [Kiloniella sp. EL199]